MHFSNEGGICIPMQLVGEATPQIRKLGQLSIYHLESIQRTKVRRLVKGLRALTYEGGLRAANLHYLENRRSRSDLVVSHYVRLKFSRRPRRRGPHFVCSNMTETDMTVLYAWLKGTGIDWH